MAVRSITPYLSLRGKGVEAIEFYEDILGATVDVIKHFTQGEDAGKVMHAELRVGAQRFYLSDGSPSGEKEPGGLVTLSLEYDDVETARATFEKLASGGKVFYDFAEVPWGGLFGALQDRFGINWMVSAG